MNANAIRTIAETEFVTAVRRRWTQTFAVACTLIVVTVARGSGVMHELGGSDGLARTSIALVPLVLALVPMAALLLGVSGHAGEPGSETFLFTQPVSRLEVLAGKWSGQLLALWSATALGLGSGCVLVAAQTGFDGWLAFVVLVAAALTLGAAFLSIAALLASASPRRGAALGASLFAWFVFVLLYDGVAIAIAQWLPGRSGARVLFGSVFGNPIDVVRLLVLTLSDVPHVLGAAGESWIRFLGGPAQAAFLSATVLALWIAAPLVAAWQVLTRRDL